MNDEVNVMEGIQPDEQARLKVVAYHLWVASNSASYVSKYLQNDIDLIRERFRIVREPQGD